ncbi:MAG: hypothetical protein RJB62_1343 [Pseudomonadota bacterium]
MQRECVDACGEFITQRRIDAPLPRHPRQAGESGGNDSHVKMGLPTGARAHRARMFRALVFNIERYGRERLIQLKMDGAFHGTGHRGLKKTEAAPCQALRFLVFCPRHPIIPS